MYKVINIKTGYEYPAKPLSDCLSVLMTAVYTCNQAYELGYRIVKA